MIPPEFVSAVGGHPIVADILWQRGYTTIEGARAFMHPDLYIPAAPEQLPGMREAVARLRAAIEHAEPIHVWGDFDVDGQTSTSLLVLGLRGRGAAVDYTIPNRARHSHGLNKEGIKQARDGGARVLLTCDCGVTDFDEIAFAQQIGLDVIVSDHHDLGARLPDVHAVVNPKRLPPDHPLADLPGVGVAFLLMQGLYEVLAGSGGDGERGRAGEGALLDLVALGIVADVANQTGDTRYLLQRGLARLRANPRPGIRALLRMANVDLANLSADTIGFQIGPRLNAVGRLDDAALSVELLTTQDEARANELAAKVEALNQERKVLQRRVEEEAFRQLAQDPGAERQPMIVLASQSWHPSVLGVVASAITNRYNKPAILISAQAGAVGRASGRSVRGIDIHAAITAQGDLIETSGGHPMAAGFAIRYENVAAFRAGVNQYVAAHQSGVAPVDDQPEAQLAWRDVSLSLCDDLERLAPFGPGNPRPLLRSNGLKPVRVDPLGREGRHQAVIFQDESGRQQRALWWRSNGQPLPDQCDLVYTLQRNVHRGKAQVQVQVARIETMGQVERLPGLAGEQYRIVDGRAAGDQLAELGRLRQEYGDANVQVWEEGVEKRADGLTRLQLQPAAVLAIMSSPPGPDELADALQRARPQTVVLLTEPPLPSQDRVENVIAWVSGMVKTSEQRHDSLDDPAVIARMAARIGHSEAAIRAGIACHRAQQAHDADLGAAAFVKIEHILGNTRGYRAYFQAAKAEEVLRIPDPE
ncbi:MAG: single-stranded-DNA-specific exonuclease RecJ [Chloroflexi bacterium]|nr:single-stranded-DNA-specific exonuclease RecJ [Chloroflexota bacterium]